MTHSVDCMRPPALRKGQVPFAQLPHHIASDPRLSPVDVRVLLALLYFAKAKPSCYPSDASIAARVGRSVPTVQRSLRLLQGLGYIDRRPAATNPTGRLIVLHWCPSLDPIGDDRPPRSRMIAPPRSSVIDEGNKEREKERPESAAGCGSPPPPAGTGDEDRSTPEDVARFWRWASGADGAGLVNFGRAALKKAGIDPDAPALAGDEAPRVAPVPAAPPDAGSPDPALALRKVKGQAAAPTEAATRPTEAVPDRPPSVAADAAGPGERPTTGPRASSSAIRACGRGAPGSSSFSGPRPLGHDDRRRPK